MTSLKTRFAISREQSGTTIQLSTLIGKCQDIVLVIDSHVVVTLYDTQSIDTVDIHVGAHANVNWISYVCHKQVTVQLADSGVLHGVQIIAHRTICQQSLTMVMREKQADIRWVILPLVAHGAHYELTTEQIHEASDTTSDLRIVGHAFSFARFNYLGLITVDKNLSHVIVNQHSELSMSGSDVHARLRPCFKIFSSDVTCTHGAACGQPDAQHMVYLRARGIGTIQAKKIMIQTRQTNVLADLFSEDIKKTIECFLQKVFATLDQI